MKIKRVPSEDLELVELKELKQHPKNARKHNARNIGMIEDSLRKVGAARSGVIDENGTILAGNGTFEALVAAGIERVKIVEANGSEWVVVQRRGLTEEQKRVLAISDNRSGELAEWDASVLEAQEIDLAPWFFPDELKEIGTLCATEPDEGTDPSQIFEGPATVRFFQNGKLTQEIALSDRSWTVSVSLDKNLSP